MCPMQEFAGSASALPAFLGQSDVSDSQLSQVSAIFASSLKGTPK